MVHSAPHPPHGSTFVRVASTRFKRLDRRSHGFYAAQTVSKQLAARRIHQHRVRLGLSPEQYGVRIGVSGMTVRRVEAGYRPFLSTQAKFARDLQVEVDELFGLPPRRVLAVTA